MTPEQEKELADAILVCGVGRWSADNHHVWLPNGNQVLAVDEFIRDWRVAGAMMELVKEAGHRTEATHDGHVHIVRRGYQFFNKLALLGQAKNESLPIAINQACVAALRGKDNEG